MDNNINPDDFWNINVPPHLQTAQCPDYLEYALDNDKDREILSTPDVHYRRQTWEQVQNLIQTNRLDLLERIPSDLRKYREYCAKLVKDYGSITAFMMQERLRWEDLTPAGEPFEAAG